MATTKEAADRHVQAFNSKDLEGFVNNEAADVEFVIPGGITLRGRAQVRDYMQLFWSAFPDIKVSENYQGIAGDTAVTESMYSGTHTGTLRTPNGDIPATGKRVQGRQVAVQRIKDGQVWSEHLYFRPDGVPRCLGTHPKPKSQLTIAKGSWLSTPGTLQYSGSRALGVLRELPRQLDGFDVPDDRLNPNGGAVAIGHPEPGMS